MAPADYFDDHLWKGTVFYLTWRIVPGAPKHFFELFSICDSNVFAFDSISIRAVAAYMWLISSALHVVLFIMSCIIARFTRGQVFRGLHVCLDTLSKERLPNVECHPSLQVTELHIRSPRRKSDATMFEMEEDATRRKIIGMDPDDDACRYWNPL